MATSVLPVFACGSVAGMPNPERVRIEVADGVADVRLTRGDKHNGLDWPMFEALNEAVDELADRGGRPLRGDLG